MHEELIEKKIRSIIDSGKGKNITHEGKKVYFSKKKIDEIRLRESQHEGGVLPLLALLPLIFGGLTAAGSTAAGIATAVKSAKEAKYIDEQREKLAASTALASTTTQEGKGMYLNPYQSKTEPESGNENGNENGNGIFLEPYQGNGIFLEPYQGKGVKDFLKSIYKTNKSKEVYKSCKPILKKFGKGINIEISGDGIYLSPSE